VSPPTIAAAALLFAATIAPAQRRLEFDVGVAGGSTAALATAYTAAECGARVALLEPTDWTGGQLTASGVPAVDEAWHKITAPDGSVALDVARVARDPRNMTPWLRDALAAIGNPGAGWVSRYCFEPRRLLEEHLLPRERALAPRLTVFRETVVKSIDASGRTIRSLRAIRRTPRPGIDGYDRLPSEELADWYSPRDSARFTKETFTLAAPIFVDATEWGEVLALSGAPYLVGVDASPDAEQGDDRSGQATVYCFAQRLHVTPVDDHPRLPGAPGLGFGAYRGREDAWSKVWTYRRLLGSGAEATPGEVTLQNWNFDNESGQGGNDYPYGYLFLSRAETAAQTDNWRGGVDLDVLAGAERRAYAWHDWFRRAAPDGIDPDQITLAGDVLGTRHGLAKLPYVRDTRRSIGLDGFVLTLADLTPEFEDGQLTRLTGTPFPDRVALGAYPADIHPLVGYEYPPGVDENHPTLPFYVPLRSLTNDGFDNLLVAGKTMAQTFLANAAVRLHPIEWSSGVAAGVVAADLADSGGTTAEACADYERLRELIAPHTPVEWRLDLPSPTPERTP